MLNTYVFIDKKMYYLDQKNFHKWYLLLIFAQK